MMGKASQLFLIGDSTVADYPVTQAPMAGWGQMLPAFVKDGVQVRNHAVNGRSSKSFWQEGRFESVWQAMGEGDLLLIQFGHNDSKRDERYTDPNSSYSFYLSCYIEAAREKGALPVLVTPVERRHFDENGIWRRTHGEYPAAMIRLAQSQRVPLLDLGEKTRKKLLSLGPEKSKRLFLWLDPGRHPHYPDGIQDDTHFREEGAQVVAKMVVEGLSGLGSPFEKFVK